MTKSAFPQQSIHELAQIARFKKVSSMNGHNIRSRAWASNGGEAFGYGRTVEESLGNLSQTLCRLKLIAVKQS